MIRANTNLIICEHQLPNILILIIGGIGGLITGGLIHGWSAQPSL